MQQGRNNTKMSFVYDRNGTNAKQESNPFDEEEWDEDGGEALVDTGEPGVPVRALYDYEGAEADELSFKQGKFVIFLYNTIIINSFYFYSYLLFNYCR